uniref:NopRA1 domain-containing protein n=1 Tax=Rodentolepis nana TaxID=102285 RepID=A0A0R3TQB4_RODNA
LTQLVWPLVTRIFTESLSGERETPVSQILTTLSADLLLPTLLRLTAHSAAFADSSNLILCRLTGDVFRCLQNDRILCPSAFLKENSKHHFVLSDSCLLRIALQNQTTSTNSWCNVPPSTAFSLVSSYLDLALQLLSAEKAAFFADTESYFVGGEEEEGLKVVGAGHSPLLACLVFCYQFLVEAGGSSLRGFNIIPRLASGAPCPKTGMLDLVNKALLFFVELLTSFSLDGSNDDCVSVAEISPPSFDLPILHYRDLRSYAYWLLSNSEPFLNCLVSLTKVSVDALQIPLQSMDFDFLRFSTRADEDQIGGVSALGQHRVQSTWLAITLLHSLFPSPSTTSSSDSHFTTFLKTLSTNDAISNPYFLHLLNFLDPACTVGLTRATVSLLKKLTCFSDRFITSHLHDMQPRLLTFLTDRLRSTFSDQITRTALIDWLADIVMQDVLSGMACAPFNGPGFSLLRMISSLPSSTCVANSSASGLNVDGLQGILREALKETKANEDDPLSVNLYWSLLKLTAAIWMQPNNLFRHQIRENTDFWKLLSDPFSSHMSTMKKTKLLPSVVDLEIAGNYATVVAIELFEFLKSTQNLDDGFTEFVKKFSGDVLVPWLQIAFQLPVGSESSFSDFSKSPTMDALEWAVIRWKSVFCTLLKCNASTTDEKMYLISRSQIVDLIDACLDKAALLMSVPQSRSVVSIIDQLSVFLSAAAGFLISSSDSSTLPLFEWVHRCVGLLEHRASSSPSKHQQPSTTTKFSHYHADLFAFIALFFPKVSSQDLPAGLFERLLNLCLEVFQDVSLSPRITTIDSQAFIQAMNVIQLIWGNFDAVKLANCLIDAGIVNNLIVILAQNSTTFQGAEFCQAIIRFLTRFMLPVETKSLYPDLSAEFGIKKQWSEQSIASHSPLPQMLLCYALDLVQALKLPPTSQMMQWLAQADEYSSNSETWQDHLYPNTSWSEFILSQLRFFSLLVACEGCSGERTPVANLLSSFILANHEQLCALLTPAPAKGLLIASAVLDLYWTAMHSSKAVTKLATPTCVASAALFSGGRRNTVSLPDGVSICLPSDIWSGVYSASIHLARTCSILLLRPEIVDIPKVTSSPSGSTLKPSPELTKASTKLSISLKLLPIIRLLNSCLRVITVETPILGDLSLASASEIAALTPSATLNFATPSTEPSNTLTFGLLFSIARISSQLLISNSKTASEDHLGRRRSEILSVLVEVNELAFSLIFSQAVIWLMNPRIDTSEKHTLSRGLAVEFQSYNFLSRSSRRGRKSIGGQTPIRGGISSSPCKRSFVDVSNTVGESSLQELFTFIECAERFSELVK